MSECAAEDLDRLAEAARSGDDAAADALLRAIYPRIRRWALVRTRSAEGMDDVAQETLIRIHRHLGSFAGRSRFSTWAYTIARSAAADWHRRHSSFRAHEEDLSALDRVTSPAPATGGELDRRRLLGLVEMFFRELPDRQREVFDLVELQGHSPAEAAELLDMKAVSVRANLHKARRAIRARVLAAHEALVEDAR